MKISKRIGRMALEAVGTAPSEWDSEISCAIEIAFDPMWWCSERMLHGDFYRASKHGDTTLCLIASIAGVRP